MSTSQGSLSLAQLDLLRASVVQEVQAIINEDHLQEQFRLDRDFRQQREEIEQLRNSVETIKQRLEEAEHDAANASAIGTLTARQGCRCQQSRCIEGHPQSGGSVGGLERSAQGEIPSAHENNPGEIRGATEIRPQRSAVNVEHWHLDGTVIQGRGFRVGIGINLGAFFACLGVFLLYLGAVCFYIGALLST
ncbi:hypothetical protein EV715DRAFT_291339 [Schizophyllum commune]